MAHKGRIEYYKGTDGWRWRFVAINGEPICHAGEAFSSKRNCINSIRTVMEYFVAFSNHGCLTEVEHDHSQHDDIENYLIDTTEEQ